MKLFPEPYDSLRREAGVSTLAAALALLAIWLVPGSLASLETVVMARLAGRTVPVWAAVAGQAPAWLAYGLLSPLILWAGERLPLEGRPLAPRLLAHLLLALACGACYAAVATTTWRAMTPYPMPDTMTWSRMALSWFLSALPLMVLTYFGVLGAGRALHWFARNRQSELEASRLTAQLSEARLGALRMQLHPHFLFNSLNAVTVLVRDGMNAEAEEVLELLSGLLRSSLRADGRHRIPLAEELDFIRRYLDVERVRFSDRLRVDVDVAPDLDDALVPALVLQPLVENALLHGVGRSAAAGALGIGARLEDDRLVLEVRDDGPGPRARPDAGAAASATRGAGVGLENTRARLAALYGDAASCQLTEAPGGGALARVVLPLERAAEPEPEPAGV